MSLLLIWKQQPGLVQVLCCGVCCPLVSFTVLLQLSPPPPLITSLFPFLELTNVFPYHRASTHPAPCVWFPSISLSSFNLQHACEFLHGWVSLCSSSTHTDAFTILCCNCLAIFLFHNQKVLCLFFYCCVILFWETKDLPPIWKFNQSDMEENSNVPKGLFVVEYCFNYYIYLFFMFECLACMFLCAPCTCLEPVEARGGYQIL